MTYRLHTTYRLRSSLVVDHKCGMCVLHMMCLCWPVCSCHLSSSCIYRHVLTLLLLPLVLMRLTTGTPVQNNLGELHALMEFAVPGLLGSAKDFKAAFEKPINAGQDRWVAA